MGSFIWMNLMAVFVFINCTNIAEEFLSCSPLQFCDSVMQIQKKDKVKICNGNHLEQKSVWL